MKKNSHVSAEEKRCRRDQQDLVILPHPLLPPEKSSPVSKTDRKCFTHSANQRQKCTSCQSDTGKKKSGSTPEKTSQKKFPSDYSNGASSGSRIVWRRVLLIAEGTFLWQTGTGI